MIFFVIYSVYPISFINKNDQEEKKVIKIPKQV